MAFKLHLDCIFPSGLRGGTGQARIFSDTAVFPEIINSTFASSKTAFPKSHWDWRGVVAWLGIMKIGEKEALSSFSPVCWVRCFQNCFRRFPERASGDGKYFHEPGSEYAGAGQCSHTARPESHGGTAGAEPTKGYSQQPDDHVFSAEHVGTDTDSHQHHGIPGTDGIRTAYGRVCSDSAGDFLFDDGRYHCGQPVPAHQPAEPDYSAVSPEEPVCSLQASSGFSFSLAGNRLTSTLPPLPMCFSLSRHHRLLSCRACGKESMCTMPSWKGPKRDFHCRAHHSLLGGHPGFPSVCSVLRAPWIFWFRASPGWYGVAE